MKTKFYLAMTLSTLLSIVSVSGARECTHQHENHSQHGAQKDEMNSRGDHAMGFSHSKTTHHFRLMADGGAIEVSANDPKDAESRDQIRRHLEHITKLFAEGDFTKPMFTHGKVPPGVPVMTRLKSAISYRFESTDLGARVRITTANPDALAAIHEFLRFQISDHETGDSLEIESAKQ